MEIKGNDGRTKPMNISYTDSKTMEHLGEGMTTKGDLDSTHLSFVAKQCKLQVWGRYMSIPVSSFHTNSYHGLEIVLALAPYSIQKCPTFDIKQSSPETSPEDHQVRAHAYLPSSKAQSCLM